MPDLYDDKDNHLVASVPDDKEPTTRDVVADGLDKQSEGYPLPLKVAVRLLSSAIRPSEVPLADTPEFKKITEGRHREGDAWVKDEAPATQAPITTSQAPSELAPKDKEPIAKAHSGSSNPGIKEPVYQNIVPDKIENTDPTLGEAPLNKNRDEASKRLADATKALEDSGKLSPGQKLAMALIGLVPAIGGGIIGAAIHNPTSAAAGIAGGLEGSSKGLDSLNQDQKAKIALAQEGVKTEKGNLLDAQKELLARQERNADYSRGVGEKNTDEGNKAKLSNASQYNSEQRQTFLEKLKIASEERIAREHNAMELAKEHGAKSERADANQRIEKTVADNITAGKSAIARLRAEIQKNGNTQWMGGDVKHNTILSQDLPAVALALHQAQQMNARSVPGPEVDKLQEQRFPAGAFTRNDRTLAALDNAEKEIDEKAGAVAANSSHPPVTLQGNTSPAQSQQATDTRKKYGF